MWNFEDVIHWEFVTKERAVDADLYSQQLERVHELLRWRYPALVNGNRVLLQQNNARPHTPRQPSKNSGIGRNRTIMSRGESSMSGHLLKIYDIDLLPD